MGRPARSGKSERDCRDVARHRACAGACGWDSSRCATRTTGCAAALTAGRRRSRASPSSAGPTRRRTCRRGARCPRSWGTTRSSSRCRATTRPWCSTSRCRSSRTARWNAWRCAASRCRSRRLRRERKAHDRSGARSWRRGAAADWLLEGRRPRDGARPAGCVLSGGQTTHEIGKEEEESRLSQVFLAIDVSRPARARRRCAVVTAVIDDLHSAVPPPTARPRAIPASPFSEFAKRTAGSACRLTTRCGRRFCLCRTCALDAGLKPRRHWRVVTPWRSQRIPPRSPWLRGVVLRVLRGG